MAALPELPCQSIAPSPAKNHIGGEHPEANRWAPGAKGGPLHSGDEPIPNSPARGWTGPQEV